MLYRIYDIMQITNLNKYLMTLSHWEKGSMPQICKKKTQGINSTFKKPEMYTKYFIFILFLDFLIQSMDTRFNQRLAVCYAS